jgi:hypothetical protein
VRNKPLRHPQVEDLIKESQDTLARFLAVEMDTGRIFVELARAKNIRIEPEQRIALQRKAELAAHTVKRFVRRLDVDSRKHLESQLAELERAISSL